ncbi:MAG: taurine ABC transporter substrate-binding protein [Methylobacteriaceae bacterium]|nr:taurine ABC transporter substrate-binding protein [Methylobacteriaceae bacterium]MBV9702552.1 taurine ABC transporter substrate-binding protein [Methylobacteriaceae bacterium]
MKQALFAAAFGAAALAFPGTGLADSAKKVVVAYQTGAIPYAVGIVNGDFLKATGWQIDFRRFNSGAEIFAAIASGDVQIGDVGSSPFAAAASRGLDVKAVYINSVSGTDEALVVRNGSGIEKPADLRGKRLAAAPVSTDHYQLLAVLKQEGIAEKDAEVFALPQADIVAAYKRGDLDGAFVWDPALTELQKDGKILLTSKQVAERGAPTFGAWVVTGDFAKSNPDFLKSFIAVVDKYNKSYASDQAAWGPNSDNARALAKLLGGTAKEQSDRLQDVVLVPLEVQASDAWLGGGDKSGIARILKDTAGFLKDQKKITAVLSSYADFAAPDYARAALKLTN